MLPLDKKYIRAAARVLARSFYADPLFQFFSPTDATREQQLSYTFAFILAHAHHAGFVYTTSPGLEGVAIWLPSQRIRRTLLDQFRFGALTMYIKQGRACIQRQVQASTAMQALHHRLLPQPHLYLSTIGVDSPYRGQGFATQLLEPMLRKADEADLACYLDTHNKQNVALYEHFGFNVAHSALLPGTLIQHWAMIRPSMQGQET